MVTLVGGQLESACCAAHIAVLTVKCGQGDMQQWCTLCRQPQKPVVPPPPLLSLFRSSAPVLLDNCIGAASLFTVPVFLKFWRFQEFRCAATRAQPPSPTPCATPLLHSFYFHSPRVSIRSSCPPARPDRGVACRAPRLPKCRDVTRTRSPASKPPMRQPQCLGLGFLNMTRFPPLFSPFSCPPARPGLSAACCDFRRGAARGFSGRLMR